MSQFDKNYMKYWEKAVEKSVDGTTIAGPSICAHYVNFLDIKDGQKVLDLGCSFGRMCEVLSQKTSAVYGVDVDSEVVKTAAMQPYTQVKQGQAEKVDFASDYFNHVMAWAVFDCVEQSQALQEANRILQNHGRLLITGKNLRYHHDDELAFVAERNAFAKGFPNRFTDLDTLMENSQKWGFLVQKLFVFPKRGDLGLNRGHMGKEKPILGYEFVMILEKVAPCEKSQLFPQITQAFSMVAEEKAQARGFDSTADFLKMAYLESWT